MPPPIATMIARSRSVKSCRPTTWKSPGPTAVGRLGASRKIRFSTANSSPLKGSDTAAAIASVERPDDDGQDDQHYQQPAGAAGGVGELPPGDRPRAEQKRRPREPAARGAAGAQRQCPAGPDPSQTLVAAPARALGGLEVVGVELD